MFVVVYTAPGSYGGIFNKLNNITKQIYIHSALKPHFNHSYSFVTILYTVNNMVL